MPLQQVFSLTPRESRTYSGAGDRAHMLVCGVTHMPKYYSTYRYTFDQQHASNELYFPNWMAGDARAGYQAWHERRHTPHVELYYDLSAFQPHKEVALTVRFDAISESRVLIYTSAGLMGEEILNPGDNQFLIEIESTSALRLFFIHVNREASDYGGSWSFRGIDGYIA